MAITLVSAPAYCRMAAFDAQEFTYSSDRYSSSEAGITASGHADNGSSFIRVTYASHGYIVGDVITGAGFSDASLNVVATITAKAANTFDLNIAWEAGFATDLGGTWTRTNNNFMLRCQVKDSTGAVVDTLYVDANTSDQFVFDPALTLRALLTETILLLTATDPASNNAGSYYQFTLTLTELFDDEDGLQKSGDSGNETVIGGADMIMYNMVLRTGEAMQADYIMNSSAKGKFLTSYPTTYRTRVGAYHQLSYLTDDNVGYAKIIQHWRDGSAATETRIPSVGGIVDVGGRGIVPVPGSYITAAVSYIEVQVFDGSDNQVNDTFTIYVDPNDYSYKTHLMFKNHLGGFDTYTFIDRDVIDKPEMQRHKSSGTEKTFYVDPERTYQLIGPYETNAVLTWLHELYNSKVVYRIDGTSLVRVNIIPDSFILETFDLAQPRLQIKDQPIELN